MANTRSSKASQIVGVAKRQRKRTREFIKQEIARKEQLGVRVDDLKEELKELDEADGMEIDDESGPPDVNGDGTSTSNAPAPNPSTATAQGPIAGGVASTSNAPAPDPSTTTPQGPNTVGVVSTNNPPAPNSSSAIPQGPNTAGRNPNRDETGELCISLTRSLAQLSVHAGTPVAWHDLGLGKGLILQHGPLKACIYEMEPVSKNYPTENWMQVEKLSTDDYSFICAHGVVLYNGNRMDVKVSMRPKAGGSSVHWITRTKLAEFAKRETLNIIKDVWDNQEASYAQENPGYQARPFPTLGRKKSADTENRGRRS
jgi:hypothetical protein